jgi:hypothetical protein
LLSLEKSCFCKLVRLWLTWSSSIACIFICRSLLMVQSVTLVIGCFKHLLKTLFGWIRTFKFFLILCHSIHVPSSTATIVIIFVFCCFHLKYFIHTIFERKAFKHILVFELP